MESTCTRSKSVNVVKPASRQTDWTRRLDNALTWSLGLVLGARGEKDQVQGDPRPGLQRRDDQLTSLGVILFCREIQVMKKLVTQMCFSSV